MRSLTAPHTPLLALGMASLVLGIIALVLGFLPVLGVPLSAFGLVFGLVGLVAALVAPGTSLRWSVAGLTVSILALGVNLAINKAPDSSLPERPAPLWQEVPDRPFVAPPARQSDGGDEDAG